MPAFRSLVACSSSSPTTSDLSRGCAAITMGTTTHATAATRMNNFHREQPGDTASLRLLLASHDFKPHLVREERLFAVAGEADLHLPQRAEPAHVRHRPQAVFLVLNEHPDRQSRLRNVGDGWLEVR